MINKHYASAYMLLAAIGLFGVLIVLYMAKRPDALAIGVGVAVALVLPIPLIWLFGKLGYPIGQAVHCARCGAEQPAVRRPANAQQALWGGYTCAKCGAELDRRGRVRAAS